MAPAPPPQQVVSLALRDPTGAPQEVVAVLRDGSSRVVVKTQRTGAVVNTLNFGLTEPFKLVRLGERARDTTLALLGLRARDGQMRAYVYDVQTNSRLSTVIFDQYGTTVDVLAIPDVNGNGVAELVRLRTQPGPQPLFAEIRDGQTGAWITGMYFGTP
jgi:hypothetical protein